MTTSRTAELLRGGKRATFYRPGRKAVPLKPIRDIAGARASYKLPLVALQPNCMSFPVDGIVSVSGVITEGLSVSLEVSDLTNKRWERPGQSCKGTTTTKKKKDKSEDVET